MVTVGGLVKTRGGYPALREHTKGDYKSLIVVDSQGKRKRPTGKSDLVKVAINDIAIVCFNVNNQFIFNNLLKYFILWLYYNIVFLKLSIDKIK